MVGPCARWRLTGDAAKETQFVVITGIYSSHCCSRRSYPALLRTAFCGDQGEGRLLEAQGGRLLEAQGRGEAVGGPGEGEGKQGTRVPPAPPLLPVAPHLHCFYMSLHWGLFPSPLRFSASRLCLPDRCLLLRGAAGISFSLTLCSDVDTEVAVKYTYD